MSWRQADRPERKSWAQIRLLVLDAQGWICQRCGGWGNQYDHIKPLSQGGALYDEDNLQTLCRGCHIAKTRGENQIYPRNSDGNPDSLQAAVFLATIVDVTVDS